MQEYICLDCGHQFKIRKKTAELSKPRQCPKCWSYHVIPVAEYIKSKQRAIELIKTTPLGIIPLWDIVRGVFQERGVRLTPIVTLKLCSLIYQDIVKELSHS